MRQKSLNAISRNFWFFDASRCNQSETRICYQYVAYILSACRYAVPGPSPCLYQPCGKRRITADTARSYDNYIYQSMSYSLPM